MLDHIGVTSRFQLCWNQDPRHPPRLSKTLQSTPSLDSIPEDDHSHSDACTDPRTEAGSQHMPTSCLHSIYTILYVVVGSKLSPIVTLSQIPFVPSLSRCGTP